MSKFKQIIEEEKKKEWIKENYQLLDEVHFSRVMTKYFDKGFIIVSAERTCEAEKGRKCSAKEMEHQQWTNKQNDKDIHWDFTRAKFGFVPVYGGYREKVSAPDGTESFVAEPVIEKSYIVPNNHENIEDIKKLGMFLCKKYNQDSFLFKPPNAEDTKAYFVDRNGGVIDTFTGKTISDMTQQYYTHLRKENPVKRFSFKEWIHYVPESPDGATAARERYGEIFIKFAKE